MPATPLPENTPWPVAPWNLAYDTWAENDAWFSGDVSAIIRAVNAPERATHHVRGADHRGGVRGAVAAGRRLFWKQLVPAGEERVRLHIPAPADVASLSSDLLFASPPDIYYPAPEVEAAAPSSGLVDPSGQPIVRPATGVVDGALVKRNARLEQIASSEQAHAGYLEGGQYASAFGASSLRLVWDEQTSDRVWFEPVAPDVTIPEFRFGKLIAISYWTAYPVSGDLTYRHLERHEIGFISHTLYLGTSRSIGRIVPLESRPETAPLAKLTNATFEGLTIVQATGISRLTAAWWINQPARSWRRGGPLAEAGRSDYAGGITGQFDALDEAWSSWVNDLDLGRARLIVPKQFLTSNGRGNGASFDRERALYSGIDAPGQAGGKLGDSIEQVQFAIRGDEHAKLTKALYDGILRSAGLADDDQSADQQVGDRTATEVLSGGARKESTRKRKSLYAQMAMADLLQAAMLLDGVKFPGKGGGDFEAPRIDFADTGQVDPFKNAQTISTLRAAKVMSVWEGIAESHPGWKDADIQREVDRLKDEGAIADPATVGNPAQDPSAAAANLPNVDEAARRLGLQVTGG